MCGAAGARRTGDDRDSGEVTAPSPPATLEKRLPLIPTIVVAAAIAVMIGLGVWQLQKAPKKEALLEQYRAALQMPPITYPTIPAAGDLPLYRYATAMCVRPGARRATAGRNSAGETGYVHIVDCSTGAEGPGLSVQVGWSLDPNVKFDWRGGPVSGVIVPDDRLWELPFQALMPDAAHHLIEESAISYAPSLAVLREMIAVRGKRKASDQTAELLALGNPALGPQTVERVKLTLRDEKLDPLPEAEREVKLLAQLYGASQSKVYVGAEAREETAKSEAGRFRVLHFATHGILNDASPMYSNLVLTQGSASR